VLRASPSQAGKTGKCPHCGQTVRLPEKAPEIKPAAPDDRRTIHVWQLAALGVLALVLGGAGLWVALLPRSPPDVLNVNLGVEAVAGVDESGFYNQETDSLGRPFRWTDGKARLVIPLDRTKPPRALRMNLHTQRPSQVPPMTLQVVVNGRDLFNEVTRGEWEKTIDLAEIDLGEQLTLEINSSVFVPQNVPVLNSSDSRPLGVRVTEIRLLGPAE
jgi:hypothetical protein